MNWGDGAEVEDLSDPESTHLLLGDLVVSGQKFFLKSFLGLNLDTDSDRGFVICDGSMLSDVS